MLFGSSNCILQKAWRVLGKSSATSLPLCHKPARQLCRSPNAYPLPGPCTSLCPHSRGKTQAPEPDCLCLVPTLAAPRTSHESLSLWVIFFSCHVCLRTVSTPQGSCRPLPNVASREVEQPGDVPKATRFHYVCGTHSGLNTGVNFTPKQSCPVLQPSWAVHFVQKHFMEHLPCA